MTNYYSIPSFLITIFGFYVFLYSYDFLSGIKRQIIKYDLIIISISSLLMILNNIYNTQYLKVPVTLLIITFFFFFIYKNDFKRTLYLSIFICLLSLFVEFLISILLASFVTDIKNLNQSLLIKDGFSLLYFWSFYFVAKLPIIKFLYEKILLIFEKQKNLIYLVYGLLFIIGYLYAFYALNYRNMQIYIYSLLIICIFVILIYSYCKELHNNLLLNIKNKNLMDNQILFNNTIDDFRILKHNLLNDFLFISSLCNNDVKKIIEEKISKYDINISNFNDLRNVPEGLQGILYFKSSFARKKGIDFYIDCDNFKCQKLERRLYIDLCEIVGVTLDNAIEASSLAISKAIYINIKNLDDKIMIEILNTYSNDIDLDNIGNKDYSTKKRNSGLGLYYIKKLNTNIEIQNSFLFDLFKIKIAIKK